MPRSASIFHSLTTRLVLIGGLIIILVIGFILVSTDKLFSKLIPTEINSLVSETNLLLNGALAPLVFTDDLGSTTEFLARIENIKSPLITYIGVYETNGTLYAKIGGAPKELHNTPVARDLDYTQKVVQSVIELKVADETVGKAAYGISMVHLYQLNNSIKNQVLLIGAIGLLLVVIFLGGFGFILYKRVRRLTEAAHSLAETGEIQNIKIKGKDEIGTLAQDFTKMAEVIQERNNALFKSETKFKALFMENRDGIGVADAQTGIILECNQSLADMVGHRREDLIGEHQSVLHPPSPNENQFIETFLQHISDRQGEMIETQIQTASGELIDVEIKANLIDLQGKKLVQGIFHDVTEKNIATKALKASEERFELAMHFANDGLFDWNLETNEIIYSTGWKKMLGYEDHEIKDEFSEWERLTKPEDIKSSWKMLNEVLEGKRDRFLKEFQMQHKDGHWVDILSRANIIFNDEGKGIRVVGTHIDISERKKMEKELRDSEAKYRNMMESFADPLYICSYDFTVEYMNPPMIRRIGRDASGEKCYSALHGLDSKCDWCIFDQVSEDKTIETSIKSPLDGRNYRVSNMPIRNQNGTISKMTIFRDITDYLEAVSEKEKAQKQLIQSQKMESIGNLAGGIAHDFNNILSSVIGFTELALDSVEKDSMIENDLQEVYTAGKRAKELVAQILAFARQSEEELKPIQVDVIVKEVLQFIRSSIPTDIEIKKDIDSDSLIMGNPTQVHQIMMNLCTNAAHAMEDDGGTLDVTLKDILVEKNVSKNLDLKPGNYIKLTVSDTGTGIPPDIIDSIFEPYFTTKDPGEGTGMGLAMVLGIIESYGGKITVNSTLGKGATFTAYLPITRKRKVQRQYEPEELPKGTERILFVDDEEPIAKMGRQGLELLGYQVATRTSSVEALELFKSKPNEFDLVITDMTMPNMTGDKLAMELMKIRPDIPIILCTGYSKKISDDSASEIGIKAFTYKPVVKADLAKTVRKVLDEAKI